MQDSSSSSSLGPRRQAALVRCKATSFASVNASLAAGGDNDACSDVEPGRASSSAPVDASLGGGGNDDASLDVGLDFAPSCAPADASVNAGGPKPIAPGCCGACKQASAILQECEEESVERFLLLRKKKLRRLEEAGDNVGPRVDEFQKVAYAYAQCVAAAPGEREYLQKLLGHFLPELDASLLGRYFDKEYVESMVLRVGCGKGVGGKRRCVDGDDAV